jgi:dipeptidyl aminopeptidase/acylaminoacyl peptidase
VHAASERGFLVCPTGNGSCGPGAYNAPTWTEPFEKMDEDLERAIGAVMKEYPEEIARDGAVLTGFSKGAYAAARIAAMHPGRWPYLVLNEADVTLTVPMLRAAGVRAVALIAGEVGGQIAGERRTAAALAKQGYPARLWVMPRAGHFYSADIDTIMAEAIDWVIANGESADAGH